MTDRHPGDKAIRGRSVVLTLLMIVGCGRFCDLAANFEAPSGHDRATSETVLTGSSKWRAGTRRRRSLRHSLQTERRG